MGEEILINITPREVRAALLENGVLQEVTVERAARRGLISNIYKELSGNGIYRLHCTLFHTYTVRNHYRILSH